MIMMPVPKDIRTFEPRALGPFTKRQAISVGAAFVVAGLTYTLGGMIIDDNNALLFVIILLCVPILMCGFIDVYGMPVWVYLKDVVVEQIIAPKNLIYKTNNIFDPFATQNMIKYEHFDSNEGLTEKQIRKKERNAKKIAKKRLNMFYKAHPELKPID